MKIDFSQALKDFDGEFLKILKGTEEIPLTLAKVCINSLGNAYQGETLTVSEGMIRYDLGIAIAAVIEPLELLPALIEVLKTVIPKGYPGPLVWAQSLKMLDPKE